MMTVFLNPKHSTFDRIRSSRTGRSVCIRGRVCRRRDSRSVSHPIDDCDQLPQPSLGEGSKTWTNGSSYSGAFVDGEMHGHGVFIDVDNSQYEGEWRNNRRNGIEKYNMAIKKFMIFLNWFRNWWITSSIIWGIARRQLQEPLVRRQWETCLCRQTHHIRGKLGTNPKPSTHPFLHVEQLLLFCYIILSSFYLA